VLYGQKRVENRQFFLFLLYVFFIFSILTLRQNFKLFSPRILSEIFFVSIEGFLLVRMLKQSWQILLAVTIADRQKREEKTDFFF
jgi:hypothetical protein